MVQYGLMMTLKVVTSSHAYILGNKYLLCFWRTLILSIKEFLIDKIAIEIYFRVAYCPTWLREDSELK